MPAGAGIRILAEGGGFAYIGADGGFAFKQIPSNPSRKPNYWLASAGNDDARWRGHQNLGGERGIQVTPSKCPDLPRYFESSTHRRGVALCRTSHNSNTAPRSSHRGHMEVQVPAEVWAPAVRPKRHPAHQAARLSCRDTCRHSPRHVLLERQVRREAAWQLLAEQLCHATEFKREKHHYAPRPISLMTQQCSGRLSAKTAEGLSPKDMPTGTRSPGPGLLNDGKAGMCDRG